jgi:hydrogenase-4 component B
MRFSVLLHILVGTTLTTGLLFFLTLGFYAAGALSGFIFIPRKQLTSAFEKKAAELGKNLGFLLSFLGSTAGLLLSVSIVLTGKPLQLELPQTTPLGSMTFTVDQLSAFFVGTASFLGAAISVYSLGYTSGYFNKRHVGLFIFLYNSLFITLLVLLTTSNFIFFLFAWEAMSFVIYFLIVFEHDDKASRRAGFLYVVMSHLGTVFLTGMILIFLVQAGSFDFAAIRGNAHQISPTLKSVIFLCTLIGFGIKAGIVPLHIWLPEAHPATPSNISALMSGVVIKTGIYGIVRVSLDLLGPGPMWWGILILAIAVVSAVLGVLYALMEHDLKRLLAYHSIENIGIILMGVGTALIFNSTGNKAVATLALIAGLYHVLNHATFKGLLFLGAGSVVRATHTRNIEELGGLAKKLPYTSIFFLIGAVAISALPPLNGFISEWLTFQALLLGFTTADLTVKLAIPITVALLALTGALAAACFVKAYGITFLGLPRSNAADHAQESPRSMLAAMGLLALGCVVLGIFPGIALTALNPMASSLLGASMTNPVSFAGPTMILSANPSTSVAPALMLVLLAGFAGLPIVAGILLGGKMKTRIAKTWACGIETLKPRMQYTATGFSKPIRLIFSAIYRASHEIQVSEDVSPYFKPEIRYEVTMEHVFEEKIYEPAMKGVLSLARIGRKLQTGHIQSYLAYIFIILIILLWATG